MSVRTPRQGSVRNTLKSKDAASNIRYYSSLVQTRLANTTVLAIVGSAACHGHTATKTADARLITILQLSLFNFLVIATRSRPGLDSVTASVL